MFNSYLVEVIRVIKPELRKEMGLFLDSPLFNRSGNALVLKHLFEVLCEAAPEFSEDKLVKEQIYAKVLPGQPWVQGKLEKLMVELNKLLRQFLLIKRYSREENETQMSIDWLTWLRENGMYERANQSLLKLDQQLNDTQAESLEYFRTKFQLSEETHELQSAQNKISGDINIPALMSDLEWYYQLYRMELINRYRLRQTGTPLPDLDLTPKPKLFFESQSILFKLTAQIEALLSKPEILSEEVIILFKALQENEKFLSFQTLSQFFAFLRSLCGIMIDAGRLDFLSVLHQIQKDNLSRGLFLVNNVIASSSYINIVQVAIRTKDIDWAKEITLAYKKRLPGGDKDEFFYRFNMAHCLFAEGRLEEAIEALPESASHSHYHGIIRRLELKIYYEMGSELLHYKMFAFRKFFERTATKTIPPNVRAMQIEFFNILLQLTQSPPKDKARSQRLIERIQKKKLLADRAWLLEKAAELG